MKDDVKGLKVAKEQKQLFILMGNWIQKDEELGPAVVPGEV